MESKKINQLATELAPDLSDLTIIGDPTTGISKKITLSQMASLFTGTVEEYANLAAFPLVGVADTIYIALDTNVIYRYDTSLSAYVILSPNIINSLVFSDANGFDGTITLVGSVATLSITTALTLGSVPFIGASGALTQDNANLFFDDTNNRLGIATALPTTPLDVFGSGIIGRLNATSTNNAYLGFASNGTNKWSAGNVQSDHRFRIFSEANSAELITILQTGEFGIGIANPLTKFHIDGGATALIANLDANVSVAKSVSFRSDNSSRINLEVSGTESGSNAGADFFLRTFTDAGSLLETPFTIVRSTGVTTIKSLTLTNVLSVANGGTGSATQNFVDLTTTQSIGGAKTFTSALAGTSVTISGTFTSTITNNLVLSNNTSTTQYVYCSLANSGGNARYGVDNSSGGGLGTGTSANSAVFGNASNADVDITTNNISRLKITSAGNVGIGIASTDGKLHVNAGTGQNFVVAGDGTNICSINNYASASGFRELKSAGSPLTFYTGVAGTGSVTERMRLTGDGEILMHSTSYNSANIGQLFGLQGQAYFTVNGGTTLFLNRLTSDGLLLEFQKNTVTTGSISTNSNSLPSDFNFKKNINNLELGLNLITKLRAVSYNHKIDDDDAALGTGFIAQELEQSLIELGIEQNKYYILQYKPNEDEIQSKYWLDYTKMIPVLVKAIQEQQVQIEELKAKIK